MNYASSGRVLLATALLGGSMAALPPGVAQGAEISADLVATNDLGRKTWAAVPSPDPSGIVYDSVNKRLVIADGEVDETAHGTTLYEDTNLFLSSLDGEQLSVPSASGTTVPGGTSLPWSEEPVGISFRPSSGNFFVSDDDQDRVFEVDPGGDLVPGTSDDTVTSVSVAPSGNNDAEDLVWDTELTPEGHLLAIDGISSEVYDYAPGPNGVFDGVAPGGDDTVTQFDTAQHGTVEPEGIAYHPARRTLLVVDGTTRKIYEFSRQGALLNTITMAAASPRRPGGITVAPPSDDSPGWNLYVVDRGVDNNSGTSIANDGRFYELSADLPPVPGSDEGDGGGSDETAPDDTAPDSTIDAP